MNSGESGTDGPSWKNYLGLVALIPVEESYLRVFDKPKKVRLNRQVIDFNYADLSPFKNGDFLFYQTESKIYLWYLKHSLADSAKTHIPEGYLQYRTFRNRKEAVILQPRGGAVNALVIKGGELLAQLTLRGESRREQILQLLKREFTLQEPEMITLEEAARLSISIPDITAFTHIEIKPLELLEKAVALLKVPLIVFLLISAGFTIYESTRLEAAVEAKKRTLASLKRENGPLITTIEQQRGQNRYWQEFISRERNYPDYYSSLTRLTSLIKKQNGYLHNVEFNDNRFTIIAGLKVTEAVIIKELLATGIVEDAKVVTSVKDATKPDYSIYTLSLTLRPRQKEVKK